MGVSDELHTYKASTRAPRITGSAFSPYDTKFHSYHPTEANVYLNKSYAVAPYARLTLLRLSFDVATKE